ncbi:MAG: transcription antitermination factor NusB [Acidimicrobiales bacterium]|nr:transcription antitermination factor NusB [Acidimicrobiales bacterium]
MTVAGSRREARERALALLYEAEAKADTPAEVVAALPIEPDAYAERLVLGVGEHGGAIDGLIRRYARGWKLERMPAIDRAVLRVAIYELLFEPGVPTAAVVSEAVELASEYSTDESGRFVNGLLARIAGEVRDGDGVPLEWVPDEEELDDEELDEWIDEDLPAGEVPAAGEDRDADAEPEPAPEPESETEVEPAVEPEPESETEVEPEPEPQPAPEPAAAVEPESAPEPEPAPPAADVGQRPPLPLPQPPLGDGVVRLRSWQAADAPALVAAWADPAVARWSAPPAARSLVDARRWIDGTPRLRERGLSLDLVVAGIGARPEVLGEVGLAAFDDEGGAQIGYWIAAPHRGKGHATRAVRLVTSWAVRDLGLHRVVAEVDPVNRASVGVVRRAGFRAESPSRWVFPA